MIMTLKQEKVNFVSYDQLTDKPPEEAFPFILTYEFRCPFNAGYIINNLEPNNYDILTTLHQTKCEWV